MLTESNMQKLFEFAWYKQLLSKRYNFTNLTNERTINTFVDKTFKIWRYWFVFKINNCLWKKENKRSHAKFDYRFFFQSTLIWPILKHFEKKHFKVRWLGPKFNAIWEKNFKVRNCTNTSDDDIIRLFWKVVPSSKWVCVIRLAGNEWWDEGMEIPDEIVGVGFGFGYKVCYNAHIISYHIISYHIITYQVSSSGTLLSYHYQPHSWQA